MTNDARRFSPSTARNRDVIRDAFLALMPDKGRALEVAAGSGEHGVHIGAALPDLKWWTGDPDQSVHGSIAAWIAHEGLTNVMGPHEIDVTSDDWGLDTFAPIDALIAINMVHISPIEATRGLLAGAARYLSPEGRVFLYGPYRRNGQHTAPSNASFDEDLKRRNPLWGIRDLEHEIAPLCADFGLAIMEIITMPANNFSIILGHQRQSLEK